MGLRERKKLKLRQELIENAIALFRASPYERVRVRDIAARCDVSEATFFNYFPSKDAVLSAWSRDALEAAFGRANADTSDQGPRRTVRDLIQGVAAQVEDDARLAQLAWSRARICDLRATSPGPATDGSAGGKPRDATGGGCLAPEDPCLALLARARDRGEIRGDVPLEQLAELLRGTVAVTLARWLVADSDDRREPLAIRLQRAVDLLLDGFRKRNERVSGPVPGSAQARPSANAERRPRSR